MKWYHFTGIDEFRKAVEAEALVSRFERLREQAKECSQEAEEDTQQYLRQFRNRKGEDEYERNDNIWFAPDNSRSMGERGNDVVMGFELPDEPNKGAFLALPKVTLNHLVDVGVLHTQDLEVKRILFTSHDGKYKGIPVYEI